MFDIGFSELMVIGLVALIVIGPERLPRVARTLGHLAGRLQRYVNDVKADINREVELDELRKMRDTVQQAASGFESAVQTELNKTESELNQAAESAAIGFCTINAFPARATSRAIRSCVSSGVATITASTSSRRNTAARSVDAAAPNFAAAAAVRNPSRPTIQRGSASGTCARPPRW